MNLTAIGFALGYATGEMKQAAVKKRRAWLPWAAAAGAAALPTASAAQYLLRDYPQTRSVLKTAPLFSDDSVMKQVSEGDLALSLQSPTDVSLSRSGSVISGNPVYHGMVVGPQTENAGNGVSGDRGLTEGGWSWPSRSDAGGTWPSGAASPSLLDRGYDLLGKVREDNLPLSKALSVSREQAARALAEQKLPVTEERLDRAYGSLSDQLSDDPATLILRRPGVANPAVAARAAHAMSFLKPYSEAAAVQAGASRLLAPTLAGKQDIKPCDSQYCVTPATHYMALTETPQLTSSDRAMPGDLLSNKELKPVALYVNAGDPDMRGLQPEQQRQKLLDWNDGFRNRRLAAGLGAAAVLGVGAYGIVRALQHYKEKKEQRKRGNVLP